MERECSICGQPIPRKSRLAQTFAGRTREEIMRNLPRLADPGKLPLREAPDGMLWVEVCMACWIDTGNGRG